ncbi:NTP transferase domain-containing protein [Candidatus Protochlamydia phocaeensis]|uniref:phosphocholine cytidylyltransferase family protein n=1 Tax=Candidatus Protochlamydia phocaeensis TaxID=1414722 RepID=UPI000838F65B|nr:phosphocholine cytidylyltransferase family protein [Candidatus Protochlamydia phocaeensis]
MKVVILAAGVGSRLDGKEDHRPKALTQLVNGKSILQFQLDALEEYLSLDQVYLVVGYQKEAIMSVFPDLIYIYNPLFEQENTAKSLLRALRKIDDDVLWLNGDVVFHPSILSKILRKDCTGMIVNQASVEEEEVKYRTNEEGRILEVSKQVGQPQGEALGINYYKQADLPLLKQNLADCHPKDYFEKGIEKGIQSGQIVWSIPVASNECAEIDFPDDLVRANQLIKEWRL